VSDHELVRSAFRRALTALNGNPAIALNAVLVGARQDPSLDRAITAAMAAGEWRRVVREELCATATQDATAG